MKLFIILLLLSGCGKEICTETKTNTEGCVIRTCGPVCKPDATFCIRSDTRIICRDRTNQ